MAQLHHPPSWLDLLASSARLSRLAEARPARLLPVQGPLAAEALLPYFHQRERALVVHGPGAHEQVSSMELARSIEQEAMLWRGLPIARTRALCLQNSLFRSVDATGLTRILFQLSRHFHLQAPLALATEADGLRIADLDVQLCHDDLLALLRGLGFNVLGLVFSPRSRHCWDHLLEVLQRARAHGFERSLLAIDDAGQPPLVPEHPRRLAAEKLVDALWPGPFPGPFWETVLEYGHFTRNQRGVYWSSPAIECRELNQIGLGPAAKSLGEHFSASNHVCWSDYHRSIEAGQWAFALSRSDSPEQRRLS